MSSLFEEAKKAFPSDICSISLTRQISDDATTTSGVCTAAFLQATSTSNTKQPITWTSLVESMNASLGMENQETLLQSSQCKNVTDNMMIVPPSSRIIAKRRALLIGIDYNDTQSTTTPCYKCVLDMKQYLMEQQGFDESDDMTVLLDQPGKDYFPTRTNILTSFCNLVKQSRAGDAVFVHFVGRSGRILDTVQNKGRYIHTILPVDVHKAGPILANEIFQSLLCPMRRGVTLTCLFDCSNGDSSAAIELPYAYTVSKEKDNDNDEEEELQRMYRNDGFDFSALVGLAIVAGILVAVGSSGDGDVASGAVGGGGNTGGTGAASSDNEDDCCGECCQGLLEGLFE